MIHTGMIFCKINRNIFEKFRSHPGTYWHKQDGTWANTSYTSDGLTYLQARYVRKKGYEAVHVTCRLNFKRLVEKENHVLTYKESDHNAVVQAFNEIMLEVGLPLWDYWQVSRIDYCVDVKTDHVADYIHLMQKGSIPYSQKLPYEDSPESFMYLDEAVQEDDEP